MQHVPAQPPLAQGSAQSPIAVSPQPHAHSHSHPHARPAGNVPMQSAPTQSTPTQAAPTQNAPAQPGTTAPPAPKRKRVQVPAACMQCKKAHAACSYTRPCDRCVRINQAAQCVSSPFPSTLRGTGEVSYLENIPFPIENGAVDSTSLATPVPPLTSAPSAVPPSPVPVTFMNTSIGENELSRFLFEDNADFTNMEIPMFESVETHSPCGQFPQTTPPTTSPSSASSSSSSSTSPTNSPVPSPAPSTVSTPAPTQMDQSDSTMYHNFGPPQTAPTSNMSASTIAAVIASGASNSQNYPQDVLRQGIPPTPQTPLETMMSEMLNQNKRMEGLVGSMHQEIASLKQELTNIKSGPTAVTKLDKSGASVPGTAVWSIQEGVLLEYNERFCNIVELKEIPQGYRMQHFFGGPCSNAAKARMNQHLSNLQNSQPATDYAVVERKKLSGEVMRLMIVVNVIPTPIPVFLTVMWEL